MNFIDQTGELRSDKDLREAIDVVNQIMIKQPLVLPLFTVHAGIIKDCLLELQAYRKLLARAREERMRKDSQA